MRFTKWLFSDKKPKEDVRIRAFQKQDGIIAIKKPPYL